MNKFTSLTSVCTWANCKQISWLDEETPYVIKDGLFCYFAQDEQKDYHLVMTSLRDLLEM